MILPFLVFDFAIDDGGLVPGGSPGQWEHGVPTVGPGGTTTLWATGLDGPYLNDSEDTLEIPVPDLSGATRPVLMLTHSYDLFDGDGGVLEVDDGSGFASVEPAYGYPDVEGFTGDSGGSVTHGFDLSGFGPTPRARFVFRADLSLAADGWFLERLDLYDGDPIAPQVTMTEVPVDTQDLDGPYVMGATVLDDVGVISVEVVARFDGGPEQVFPGTLAGDDVEVELPALDPDTVVAWHLVASDGVNEARFPESAEATFRVFLAPPRNLMADIGPHEVGNTVRLSWTKPDTFHPVEGYRVFQDNVFVADTLSRSVDVFIEDDEPTWFSVAALYAEGEGDRSEPLALDDLELPTLDALQPDLGFPGDRLWVDIRGTSLYLLQDVSTVDLGDGIDVLQVDVHDVQTASALIRIAADAEPGTRTLTLKGTVGKHRFDDAFTVGSTGGAPAIESVTPRRIEQGDTAVITLQATEDFGASGTVDAGDLFVVGPVTIDGSTCTLELAVPGDARPGKHTVVLDDGARLWTFEVEVTEFVASLEPTCSTGPVAGPIAVVAMLGLIRRRRGPR